jgi:hypothetical protein
MTYIVVVNHNDSNALVKIKPTNANIENTYFIL